METASRGVGSVPDSNQVQTRRTLKGASSLTAEDFVSQLFNGGGCLLVGEYRGTKCQLVEWPAGFKDGKPRPAGFFFKVVHSIEITETDAESGLAQTYVVTLNERFPKGDRGDGYRPPYEKGQKVVVRHRVPIPEGSDTMQAACDFGRISVLTGAAQSE